MEKYIVEMYEIADKLFDREKIITLLLDLISKDISSSYLFEITDFNNIKAIQKKCPEIDLTKYYFKNKCFDKTFDFISNLNETWDNSNPNKVPILQKNEFISILNFFKNSGRCYSTAIYGIDGIKWSKNTKNNIHITGTYGYEKAKSYFYEGQNYLSNSIIVSKVTLDKNIKIYVSHKVSEEEDYYYLHKVQEYLGKATYTRIFYAPTTLEERIEFEKRKAKDKEKYLELINKIHTNKIKLPYELHDVTFEYDYTEPINVRKLVKEIFLKKEWQPFKRDYKSFGIPIKRIKEDVEIELYIDATHKGHYMQTILAYNSKYFYCGENINYIYYLKNEEEVKKYLENIKIIGDTIYEQL